MATPGVLERRDRPGRRARGRSGRRRGRRRRGGRLVALGALPLVAAGTVTGVVLSRHTSSAPPPQCTVAGYTLSPDQAQNASIIAAVAYAKGLPDHAVTIALATALQESRLANLPYGDRDSVGLFQQRPSQGWGPRSELLDPAYASAAFYAHLVKLPGWTAMPVTEAAQGVQLSAAPDAYAQWEGEARTLAVALTGESPAAFTCRFAHFGGAPPAAGSLQQAMSAEMGADLVGVPVPAKAGWAAASWTVAHAYNYHLSRVSFGAWTWRSGTGKWSSGATAGGASAPGVVSFSP